MTIDISVRFRDLHRSENSNVTGSLSLRVSGNILGREFDIPVDGRDFNFPQGQDQRIYDQSFEAGDFKATVTASVHERTAGQCCLQGHIHVDGPIGGGIGKDLDPNCQTIV